MEALKDPSKLEVGYGGAKAGGKSYFGISWCVEHCVNYAGLRAVIVRRHYTNMQTTIVNTMFKVLDAMGLEMGVHYKWLSKAMKLEFINGSVMEFKAMPDDPSDPLFKTQGGWEYTIAYFDEANEISQKAYEAVVRTLRWKNKELGVLPKRLLTFNPSQGWTKTRFWVPLKTDTMPDDRDFIIALPSDNPHNTPEYLDILRTTGSEEDIQRYFYGNFDYADTESSFVMVDAVYKMFSNKDIGPGKKYMSVDVAGAGSDDTVITVWDGMNCIKIDKHPVTKTHEVVQLILQTRSQYNIPMTHIVIDETGLGYGVLTHPLMEGAVGFMSSRSCIKEETNLHQEQKSGRIRVSKQRIANYYNLRAQCAWRLADRINSGLLAVDCPSVMHDEIFYQLTSLKDITDYGSGKKKQLIGKKQMKADLGGKSPDIVDTFIMRMYFDIMDMHRSRYVPLDSPEVEATFIEIQDYD